MSAPAPTPSTPPNQGVFATLPQPLLQALANQGITEPTPVQSAVIPSAVGGHDVLGRAQTGSGKTLAFGIPILARLAGQKSRPRHPRAVIVVPTRELANQVARAMNPLAGSLGLKIVTVYGGTPYDRQVRSLRQGADIVVATPGRLDDLIEKGACALGAVEVTVLDEADHLCDLGFYPAVDKLVSMTPAGSQRMLLSATLDGDVDRLVRAHLRKPRVHELDPSAGAVTTMTHHTLVVGGFRDKVEAVVALIEANGRTIVFTRTRDGAVELAAALTEKGVEAVDLHGDLSQRVRERNLRRFSSGQAQAVVATDVAARGIHVDNVDLVIHFDAANDPKAYLHRSGRTARAGLNGAVVTITTPKFVDSLVRLHRGAGVEVLHHDLRTVPRPMTAEALVGSGSPAPAASSYAKSSGARSWGAGSSRAGSSGQRTYAPRGGGYQGAKDGDRKPSRGQGGGRPGSSGSGRPGGQQQWSRSRPQGS